MAIRILIICGSSGANLLGQRNILGVHAELQIDISREIKARLKQAQDLYSQFVELDRYIGTTGLLLQEARFWILQAGSRKSLYSVHAQTRVEPNPDIQHLQFLLDYLPATVPLEQVLAQSPAIGGLAIRHPQNRVALEQVLERITAPLGVGPENPIEAWIVSSTVDGVGGGIHRFVGAFLAEFIRRRYVGTPIRLNFIRIGPLTYRSVNPRQVALNTLFGIAADAAFALQIPQDFPEVATSWFYIDFPDVGIGEQGTSLRMQMVEMAAKVIMWEALEKDLQRLIAHNHGIPVAITRMGYWGKEFSEQWKYYEALRQLREQLQELIEPDYQQKYVREGAQRPQFVAARLVEWLERIGDEQYILRQLESGWQFPRYQLNKYPQGLDEVQGLVEKWKSIIETLVGRKWEELQTECVIEGAAGREALRIAEPGEAPFGTEAWFKQVEKAHMARAWVRQLLGCNMKTGQLERGENLLEKLLKEAQRVSSILNGFNPFRKREKRAQEVKETLIEFIKTLAQVDALLNLEVRAQRFLEKETAPVRHILEVANAEFKALWSQWAQPDYTQYIDQEGPTFSFSEVMSERASFVQDEEKLRAYLQQGWRLPAYRGFPRSLDDVRTRVVTWRKALESLMGVEWVPDGELIIKISTKVDGKVQEEVYSIEKWLSEEENTWKRVENAHFLRAWSWHLLGCDLRNGKPVQKSGTPLEKLERQAQKLIRLQFLAHVPFSWWLKKVAHWMSPVLGEFLAQLAYVDCLLRAEEAATKVLEQELRGDPVVITRNLSEILGQIGRMTWLQALHEGVRRAELTSFKQAVMRGISGLSERGLRQILGLSNRASIEDIHSKIHSCMGEMRINGKVVEAPWWAETPMQPTLSFDYRILPTLTPKLQELLQNMAKERAASFEYLFGFPELAIIAFSAASMAQEFGDILTAPTALIRPFVPIVKEVLSEWNYISAYNIPVRQFEVVSAGVCEEPLFELALKAAGLDDEDLKRIGQYYMFYRK
jgi:hypothetical protein